MKVVLKEISESELNNLKRPILFKSELFSKRFAIITDGIKDFGIAWRSDLIEPVITMVSENIFSIGIDQGFALIDFERDVILLSLKLNYNFFTVKIHNENLYIITELEIIKIDKISFNILYKYDLPDYFEELLFDKDNQIIVKCSENTSITIT